MIVIHYVSSLERERVIKAKRFAHLSRKRANIHIPNVICIIILINKSSFYRLINCRLEFKYLRFVSFQAFKIRQLSYMFHGDKVQSENFKFLLQNSDPWSNGICSLITEIIAKKDVCMNLKISRFAHFLFAITNIC